jgi:hypothetical protein
MKIILICSSLEPGRDGVGDYARRLGAALIKNKNQVALLALNDRYVSVLTENNQTADGLEMAVLRVPQQTLTENTQQIKSWIANFNPDWLSLQYVIFGYHHKGLPFGLSRQLQAIAGNRRWHIMFHELWLGMAAEESAKLKAWGTVQRYLIKSLIHHLKPEVIHTQTKLYQQHLSKMGYKAGYLPIFSNIPVKPEIDSGVNNMGLSFIVFGLIHTGATIDQLAAEAAQYAQRHHILVELIFVGHCGNEQEKWAAVWQQAGLPVTIHGQQPADKISILLQQASLGISSTAVAVVEKSGAFAAMCDHSLPVLNISKPWTPRGLAPQVVPAGMVVYRVGNFDAIVANRKKYITEGTKPEVIAQQMTASLLANA